MIVIIYPTGTKRSVHLNHFVVEAEKADPECKVISSEEFSLTPIDKWPDNTKFIVRVGSHYIKEVLPVLRQLWHKGMYTIFPNVPAIKTCSNKILFWQACLKNNIEVPMTKIFTKGGDDYIPYTSTDFTEFGDCVIKPSIGSLGSGIYYCKSNEVKNKISQIIASEDEFYNNCDIIVQKEIKNKKNIPQSIRVFCFNGEPTVSITLTNTKELHDKADASLKVKPEVLYNEDGEVIDSIGTDLDFESVSNLNRGGVAGPYFPSDKLKQICRNVCKATGIEFTAIDFIQDELDNFICLEANISPHLIRAFMIYKGRVNHAEMICNHLLDNSNKDSIIL
jgi:glutathione synthase/RimK-type ligase-like ATP-grasp enzyme